VGDPVPGLHGRREARSRRGAVRADRVARRWCPPGDVGRLVDSAAATRRRPGEGARQATRGDCLRPRRYLGRQYDVDRGRLRRPDRLEDSRCWGPRRRPGKPAHENGGAVRTGSTASRRAGGMLRYSALPPLQARPGRPTVYYRRGCDLRAMPGAGGRSFGETGKENGRE